FKMPMICSSVNRFFIAVPLWSGLYTVTVLNAGGRSLVAQALNDGCSTLASATEKVLTALPADSHYMAMGRIADALVRLAMVQAERERPWRTINERLEIEDWIVHKRREIE
ncbi:hypothetical protein, partial [Burkholderia ambifaria]|uniref:hypothetical protein n=1 Tax=Burkholderia ambifaria TaxID=152480 RepID=UPI001ABAFE3A